MDVILHPASKQPLRKTIMSAEAALFGFKYLFYIVCAIFTVMWGGLIHYVRKDKEKLDNTYTKKETDIIIKNHKESVQQEMDARYEKLLVTIENALYQQAEDRRVSSEGRRDYDHKLDVILNTVNKLSTDVAVTNNALVNIEKRLEKQGN